MKKAFIIILLFISSVCCFAQYAPKAKGELVTHNYYSLDYNEKHEQPNWVYYKLTRNFVEGSAERANNFRADKSVATGSAALADYTKSGYDRGHLCPAADMKQSESAMSETFFMSNMSPQAPSFNRGGWKKLEEIVRNWCVKEGEIYVVTGGIFSNPMGTIGANKVTIPSKYYKIVYAPKSKKMIAFVMPNEKLTLPTAQYVTSVDYVEEITGIDFFYQLDDATENNLEKASNARMWTF